MDKHTCDITAIDGMKVWFFHKEYWWYFCLDNDIKQNSYVYPKRSSSRMIYVRFEGYEQCSIWTY